MNLPRWLLVGLLAVLLQPLSAIPPANAQDAPAASQPQPPEDPQTELVEAHWTDGTIMERREAYTGPTGRRVNHGMYRFYYPNGQVREQLTFLHGKPVGRARHYHENGRLAHEVTFVEGQRQGTAISWDEKGDKYAEWQFKDDVPHGTWTWFYPNGNKVKQETFAPVARETFVPGDDGPLGPVGGEMMERLFGSKHGPWLWWYEDGQVGIRGEYHDDEMHGRWEYFNPRGELTETREYERGRLLNPPKHLPPEAQQSDADEDIPLIDDSGSDEPAAGEPPADEPAAPDSQPSPPETESTDQPETAPPVEADDAD